MLKQIRKVCKREAKGSILTPEQVLEHIRSGNYVPVDDTTLAKMRRDVITMYVSMEAGWRQLEPKIATMRDSVRGLCGQIPLEEYEEIMSSLRLPTMKNAQDKLDHVYDVCIASANARLDAIAQESERLIEDWSYHWCMYKTGLRALKIAKKCKPIARAELRTLLQQAWYDCANARVCLHQNAVLMIDLKRARNELAEKRKWIIMQEII